MSQNKIQSIFIILLLAICFVQYTSAQDVDCATVLSQKTKLDKAISDAQKVNETQIQADIDKYAAARKYMNQALDLMAPQNSQFIQKAQTSQQVMASPMINLQLDLQNQLKESQQSCQQYTSFASDEFVSACNQLTMIQQSQDYCSLASKADSELASRTIKKELYTKDSVCQAIYIIELLNKVQNGLKSLFVKDLLVDLQANLTIVLQNSAANKCGEFCANGTFVTSYYKRYNYTLNPDYFVDANSVGGIGSAYKSIGIKFGQAGCQKGCDLNDKCLSFDMVKDAKYCDFNKYNVADAKKAKVYIYQPKSGYQYTTAVYEKKLDNYSVTVDCPVTEN